MKAKENKTLKITDLKDMLEKTNNLYGEKIAYKIREEKGKYKTITHKEVRQMVDAMRNSINRFRIKG